MSYPLSLTQSQILTALRSVLLAALPSGIEVIRGQDNLVAEPVGADFVVMTAILRSRIETNVDLYQDVFFTGSVSGPVLTVSSVSFGTILLNSTLFGAAVAANTLITAQTGGTTGGAGTYTVSQPQTIASGPLAAGVVTLMQPTQITVQCDVHGPNSPDNVEIISTLLRSLYAADLFKAQGFDVTPLYAGDPRQSPFINAESQVETQWSVDVVLQANQTITAPQQYAASAQVTIKPPVEVTPPF